MPPVFGLPPAIQKISLNDDSARAADVESLIAHMRTVVKQQKGIELETEIKIVGEAAHA